MVDPHVPSEIVENEVLNSSHFFSKFRTLWLLWVIFLICSKYQHQNLVGGLEHVFMTFHYYLEVHHPNWLPLHDFSEGWVYHQPEIYFWFCWKSMNIHVPKVLVNSPKSSTKKKPATQAWEEAQKRPPPIVQAAKAKAQRSPTWLGEAGLWVIWLDDELDSHCWSWKKHVNPVEIDWDDGSWPNLVRM